MPDSFLRRPTVERLTGLSRSAIYDFMKEQRFPKPVSIGGNAVAWIESEVREWMQARVVERDGRAA